MSEENHPLHKAVKECLIGIDLSGYELKIDKECGGEYEIPLYCSKVGTKTSTKYCNVDFLLLKNDKIKVIVEVEETNVKPVQIFGKFLASSMSSYYIHHTKGDMPIEMGDSVLFIQVVDTKGIKENSSKIDQWNNIEKSIKNILPLGRVNQYTLIHGCVTDFENEKGVKLVNIVKNSWHGNE